jgi:hypothetical protein
MQYWRVGDLDKIVGAIEGECVADETDVGCGRSGLQRAIVGADDGECIAIGGPPSDQAARSRQTTCSFSLKSRERGARQKK